jgi:hypothetical protein
MSKKMPRREREVDIGDTRATFDATMRAFRLHDDWATVCHASLIRCAYANQARDERFVSGHLISASHIEKGLLIFEFPIEAKNMLRDINDIDCRFYSMSNFFGTFLNVELEIFGQVVDRYFEYSKEKHELMKKGKVQIRGINSIDSSQSFCIKYFKVRSQEDPDPDDMIASYFGSNGVRPVFLSDEVLFFIAWSAHYNKKLVTNEKNSPFKNRELDQMYLAGRWIYSLSRDLALYIAAILVQESTLKDIGRDLWFKDYEKRYLSTRGGRLLNESAEMYFEDPSEFRSRIFSPEWIRNFEFVSHLDCRIENSICHKLPEFTENGKYVSYFSGELETKKLELIPTKGLKELGQFWDRWHPESLLNTLDFMDGDKTPIHYDSLDEFLELHNSGGYSEAVFEEFVFSIAKEIEEDGEYTLHSNITFDLQNNVFPVVIINQDSSREWEFHCEFLNNKNEFFKITFDLREGSATLSSHRASERGHNPGINHLSLWCVMLLRDFLVAEHREAIFKVKPNKKRRNPILGRNKYGGELNVIYVPRIKYEYQQLGTLKKHYEENFPYRGRAKHKVKGHLRKLLENQTTSNEAILLARKYGYEVTAETTFVSPHERGGLTKEQRRIYRSRSILKSFFVEKKISKGDIPHWFKFENNVAEFFRKKGWEVSVTKPTNDGGKDIEGIDEQGNIVICSVKCYSPRNKVGRDKVDELIGVMTRFKNTQYYEKDKEIKGIFVTLSDFTSAAKAVAAEGGIELYSGYDLEGYL